ncbi:transcriptional regulator, TetR family [Desulfacinum hydrothermale DSM 13146]|uniref:Transcriptional regulator, TetR family n=1 Tax=Desulfacinum hydrothermale DSM 13146 TaxID=1121390 RepID=A0A1W1WZS7_9BACT|nr:TetR/AcrR family transcriptional regulator [Desulfacinum hydrothermale]SMC17154.1 transcriptional regulator, TetR family [Desulfacinum hydrothermale DSM 13146]
MKPHRFSPSRNPADNSTQRQLYRVAARLFQQKGYRATSMQDIADALGIQKASIYYYIRTKQDLLMAIARASMEMLLAEGERIARAPLPPDQKLRELLKSHVTLICRNLDLFTVSLRELTPVNAGDHWKEVVALRDRYEALLRAILREGMEKGAFRNLDEKLVGFAFLGMVNWTIRWVDPQGEKSPEEIASVWEELFLNGVRVPRDLPKG